MGRHPEMNGRAWSGLRAPESTTAGGSKMALEDLMASLGPAYVSVSHVVLSSAAIFLFQEEMGISCELLESDFLKCSVGFPFMRSKSKVRPWQRWVLPRPLSPALPISPLLLCTHAHPAPCGGWVTTRPWRVSVTGALLQVISGYITCLSEPHSPQSGMTPLCFVNG